MNILENIYSNKSQKTSDVLEIPNISQNTKNTAQRIPNLTKTSQNPTGYNLKNVKPL